jgi:hypothetical protein
MKSHRLVIGLFVTLSMGIALTFLGAPGTSWGDRDDHGRDGDHDKDDGNETHRADARIEQGMEIAPVRLNLHGRDKSQVGLGSYLVNAVGGCNDCHTCPSYEPGHSPYTGDPGRVDAEHYLAGGVHFGPFVSANITPDTKTGLPAGLTRDQFIHTLRTGQDPDPPHDLLQVMPWPVFRHMTDHDLSAIYEYLSAVPHAEPGTCTGAGE